MQQISLAVSRRAGRALPGALPPRVESAEKWRLLRALTTARAAFGVSDRDLAVLAALLSFHPEGEVAGAVVHPSNASLSERTHGMAESTLRRHLAALVRAGLIRRQDSPNGKRFVLRAEEGDLVFGFDLSPLAERAGEIARAAQASEEAARALKRARVLASLAVRDCGLLLELLGAAAAEHLPRHAELTRALRRVPEAQALADLTRQAEALLAHLRAKSEEMGGSPAENERHYQNSNKDSDDLEPCLEQAKAEPSAPPTQLPALPLAVVLKATPDVLPYAQGEIRRWRDLVAVAAFIRPMLGISPQAWNDACAAMGEETAAITLACILQSAGKIRSPGGYLRSLTAKADAGGFSPGPMVMALLRGDNARAV